MYAITAWAEILVKSENKDFEICGTAVTQASIDPSQYMQVKAQAMS